MAEVVGQRREQRMRAQRGLVDHAIGIAIKIGAVGAEVAIAQTQVDIVADRHGHACQSLPGIAVVARIDRGEAGGVFMQRDAGPAHTATGIGLDPAPVAKPEQDVAHEGGGIAAARQIARVGGVDARGALRGFHGGFVVETLGLQTELAEIIAKRAARFPAVFETVGTVVAARIGDVGPLVFHGAAFDGDIGALVLGLGGRGKRPCRHSRQSGGEKQLFHGCPSL
jgi:hypothetical protein